MMRVDEAPQPAAAKAATLVDLLVDRYQDSFSRPAVVDPFSDRRLCWGDLIHQALAAAEQLEAAGLRPGDRVVHLGPHATDWIIGDLACLLAGVVQVALHADASQVDQREQVQFFQPRGLLVSGGASLRPLSQAGLPTVSIVVDWSNPAGQAASAGSQTEPLFRRQAAAVADAPATILISSGTTGRPKGFVHTQRALVSNALAAAAEFLDEPDDVRLAWLPQSHALARVGDLYTAVVRGGCLSVVGDRLKIVEACRRLPPAVILGVPVFFDRLAAAVEAGRIPHLAAALGGRVRVCVSGGASLRRRTVATFGRQGIPLVEGYGLAEAGPVVTVSNPRITRPGAAGLPLAGIELAIDQRPASRGQVLVRTPSRAVAVMDPARGSEPQPMDATDWLETGDRGSLDDDGQLRITGRLDDVLPLSTGMKIPPAAVEAALLEEPGVAQVCVAGVGLPWPVALIVPDPVVVRRMLKRLRCRVWSRRQALAHRRLLDWFSRRLAARQQELPRTWQIRRFVLVGRPFDAAHGEATESFKLKRHVIASHFAPLLQSLADESQPVGVGVVPAASPEPRPQEPPMQEPFPNPRQNRSHDWLSTAVWQPTSAPPLGFTLAAERAADACPAEVTGVVEQALAALTELRTTGRLAEPAPSQSWSEAPLEDAPQPPWGRLSQDAEQQLAETGLWGLLVPKEYGGVGCRFADFTRVVTRLARVNPTVAGLLSVHSTIGAVAAVADWGTPQQRERWLPGLAAGKPLSVFAATEPDAGCDLGRISCRLERAGERLLLSGTKMFITGATYGRLVKLLALLDGQPVVLMVELPPGDTPEFSLRRYALHPLKHAHNAAIEFRRFPVNPADILVPGESAAGRQQDGMAIVWHGLNRGRVTLAAQAAGTIGILREQATAFAQRRQTWGEPIINRQLVLGRLGRMAAGQLACEALAGWAAAAIEAGGTGETEAVLAKVVASGCLRQAAVDALGIHGGRAFLVGHPLGDSFHDHFAAGVYEGESDLLGLALFRGVAKRHPMALRRSVAGWLGWRLVRWWRSHRAAEDFSLLDGELRGLARQAGQSLTRWSLDADRLLRRRGRELAEQQLLVASLSARLQQLIATLAVLHLADRRGDEASVLAAVCWSRQALVAATGTQLTAADHENLTALGRLQTEQLTP